MQLCNSERLVRMLYDVLVCWKSIMAAINSKLMGNNVFLISCMLDINEIQTAQSMFSGKGYTTRTLRRLPDVWICEESKMATFDRK